MSLFTKKAQLHFKQEAALDTYLAPAGSGADMVLVEVPENPVRIIGDNYTPTDIRGSFQNEQEYRGLTSIEIDFRIPLRGSGTAGTPPEWAAVMAACGHHQSADTGTNVVYTPISIFDDANVVGPPVLDNPGPSYSCTLLEDGRAYAGFGGFVRGKIVGQVGEPLFLECTFVGGYVAGTDDALEGPTYATTVPAAFQGAAMLIQAYTPIGVNAFELDFGSNVVPFADVTAAQGTHGARITSRQPTLTIDPEMALDAGYDFYGMWEAMTPQTFTTGTVGATGGNITKIDVARFVPRPIEMSNRDGVRHLNLVGQINSAAGDVETTNPEYTITLT